VGGPDVEDESAVPTPPLPERGEGDVVLLLVLLPAAARVGDSNVSFFDAAAGVCICAMETVVPAASFVLMILAPVAAPGNAKLPPLPSPVILDDDGGGKADDADADADDGDGTGRWPPLGLESVIFMNGEPSMGEEGLRGEAKEVEAEADGAVDGGGDAEEDAAVLLGVDGEGDVVDLLRENAFARYEKPNVHDRSAEEGAWVVLLLLLAGEGVDSAGEADASRGLPGNGFEVDARAKEDDVDERVEEVDAAELLVLVG